MNWYNCKNCDEIFFTQYVVIFFQEINSLTENSRTVEVKINILTKGYLSDTKINLYKKFKPQGHIRNLRWKIIVNLELLLSKFSK